MDSKIFYLTTAFCGALLYNKQMYTESREVLILNKEKFIRLRLRENNRGKNEFAVAGL